MATFAYYCDETSYHDTYMAVGGLAVAATAVPDILSMMTTINEECQICSEIKWANAKKRRKNAHEAYVNLLFDLIERGRAHLHIRFAPFNDYNHKLSGSNKRQDTVGKMHYQLLLHRPLRYYGEDGSLQIYPDNGVCTEKLPLLIDSLNIDGRVVHGHKSDCVESIRCCDSEREPMLQLLDVTLGALTAYKNKRHLDPGTSDVKRHLAELAFKKTGLTTLDRSTGISARKLNIWCVRPSWGKNDGPRPSVR